MNDNLSEPLRLAEETFQTVPSLLLNDLNTAGENGKPRLENGDIVVYLLLKAHAWQKPCCHPSYERLARLAGCSVATVRRSLCRLESATHISRKTANRTGQIVLLSDVKGGKVIRRKAPEGKPPAQFKPSSLVVPEMPSVQSSGASATDNSDVPF